MKLNLSRFNSVSTYASIKQADEVGLLHLNFWKSFVLLQHQNADSFLGVGRTKSTLRYFRISYLCIDKNTRRAWWFKITIFIIQLYKLLYRKRAKRVQISPIMYSWLFYGTVRALILLHLWFSLTLLKKVKLDNLLLDLYFDEPAGRVKIQHNS